MWNFKFEMKAEMTSRCTCGYFNLIVLFERGVFTPEAILSAHHIELNLHKLKFDFFILFNCPEF
jgi:hypothetical protein